MKFKKILMDEIKRIDDSKTSKRNELIIEGFEKNKGAPKAIIKGKSYAIFNSNDYMGLRFNDDVRKAEEKASEKYGSGPGAVRFISGTMEIHKELEKALAKFHDREDAMIFSSAFAVNMAVIHCFIKGQSKDSLVSSDTLVVSDALNHRSIIDGVRVAGLPKENRAIFKHMDMGDLKRVLKENKGKFSRVVVVTDGIFSMLGEFQDLKKMHEVIKEFRDDYEEGIISIVDDSHGVASLGVSGRGCEEATNSKADLLIATMGKGFGVDGGYVVGDKVFIDYLRESAATYIYSNPIAPGTAGAALESVKIMNSQGKDMVRKLNENIVYFQKKTQEIGFKFAAPSCHAIQPILIADPVKTRALVDGLFEEGIIVTNISYPVVPRGQDEIRVQLSSIHSKADIDEFCEKIEKVGKKLSII